MIGEKSFILSSKIVNSDRSIAKRLIIKPGISLGNYNSLASRMLVRDLCRDLFCASTRNADWLAS
jgi:hypothetical protein